MIRASDWLISLVISLSVVSALACARFEMSCAVRARVAEFLRMVDLSGAAGKFPSELSGGMRKRAALARALVAGTKVLLCDEPTSGLDPVRSRDISLLIRDLARKMGCTTVFTTHDVPNAFLTADRVIMLNQGRITAEGTQADFRRSEDAFVKDFLNQGDA